MARENKMDQIFKNIPSPTGFLLFWVWRNIKLEAYLRTSVYNLSRFKSQTEKKRIFEHSVRSKIERSYKYIKGEGVPVNFSSK